jgi:hypothetical protein
MMCMILLMLLLPPPTNRQVWVAPRVRDMRTRIADGLSALLLLLLLLLLVMVDVEVDVLEGNS